MDYEIRKMIAEDKKEVLSMMKDFYSSDAVYSNGSETIFENDFQACINEDNMYLEGYVFCLAEEITGYAMIAKSFSTEFGKPCIWFEDLYLKTEHRGQGIIPYFIKYITDKYPQNVFRLEVENDNTHAVHVYKKRGFIELPYQQMIRINANLLQY